MRPGARAAANGRGWGTALCAAASLAAGACGGSLGASAATTRAGATPAPAGIAAATPRVEVVTARTGAEGAATAVAENATTLAAGAPPARASPAAYLPASLHEAHFFPEAGTEPGGGERAVVAGVRLVAWADGTLTAAADRLPSAPSSALALPDRLGGGFVFALGSQLWRSETWLGEASPLFALPGPATQVFLGLDRLYVRTAQGSLAAVDPANRRALDLGPLPPSPRYGPLLALDAWRAIVVADLRGVLVTADAGASWRPVPLALEPRAIALRDGAFEVRAVDTAGRAQSWRVGADGHVEPAPARADSPAESGAAHPEGDRSERDVADRTPGQRALAEAIADGWLLGDGTALVARDGTLRRVRLGDGAVVAVATDAFPLSPARCKAVSLGPAGAAFGFVCGEPRGRTRLYAWKPVPGALVELRRFTDPRRVVASGSGGLVVDGGCDAQSEVSATTRATCVMLPSGAWGEVRRPRPASDREQLVVLSDGRLVAVVPPKGGDLATAHLAIVPRSALLDRTASESAPLSSSRQGSAAASPGEAPTIPIRFRGVAADVERALRLGTWMSGFEERRPGVLGGWVDAAGAVVGVAIDVDGSGRAGEFIRDAGAPIVSGRWALGWTASRSGFESIDGGMTWTKGIPLPDPIGEPKADTERACGPIGCVAAGWLRIGWGERERPAAHSPPPIRVGSTRGFSGPLRWTCSPASPLTPAPVAARAPAAARVSAPVWGTVSELPPFSGRAAPPMTATELGVVTDVANGVDLWIRGSPLGRLYAWGPATGEWDTLGRWQVRWDAPWSGWSSARASSIAPSPWSTLDGARRALGIGPGAPVVWSVIAADDADHALLTARSGASVELFALESDRPPLPVHHDGVDAFPEVESATLMSGHWYLATTQAAADPPATGIWVLDGGAARELLRLPRVTGDSHADAHLARRSDGRGLAVVARGQPDATKPSSIWLTTIDVDSARAGEPELVGPARLDEATLGACAAGEPGWDVVLPYGGDISIADRAGTFDAPLQAPMATIRVARDRACIVRAFGAVDAYASSPPGALVAPPGPVGPVAESTRGAAAPDHAPFDVSVYAARTRFAQRCWVR